MDNLLRNAEFKLTSEKFLTECAVEAGFAPGSPGTRFTWEYRVDRSYRLVRLVVFDRVTNLIAFLLERTDVEVCPDVERWRWARNVCGLTPEEAYWDTGYRPFPAVDGEVADLVLSAVDTLRAEAERVARALEIMPEDHDARLPVLQFKSVILTALRVGEEVIRGCPD